MGPNCPPHLDKVVDDVVLQPVRLDAVTPGNSISMMVKSTESPQDGGRRASFQRPINVQLGKLLTSIPRDSAP